MTGIDFALNHMAAPRLGLADFFALARSLGVSAVEIRNDIAGTAIADGTPPGDVERMADRAGLAIASINALALFDDWTAERAAQAGALIDYAAACGAGGIVLCPRNDAASAAASGDERAAALREALAALKPMLERAGIAGFVEPLGFAGCALRSKRAAVEAIRDVDGAKAFALVHDTFHHHLAGEGELFPEMTGLVHVSGVVDASIGADGLRDAHRVLVDAGDVLDTVGQVRALGAGGYRGPVSFEPFAPEVHRSPDIQAALRDSMAFISGGVARPAA
ncbi:xylose isomerase [Lichenibacterium minor]|uniref:Xylose isomerase n=1 Tax=Lichenibacterium minor TaxID=2316528 RepID=A0A4Q2U9V6_9HYPH|nr:TIM barrel protein [Lichenibacterium minor]RYC31877.1 xylose isomerase [Lichenibacterium minor]